MAEDISNLWSSKAALALETTRSWESWEKGLLGEGLYEDELRCAYANLESSEVHRAKSKKTGAIVALKKILMHNEKDGVRQAFKSCRL